MMKIRLIASTSVLAFTILLCMTAEAQDSAEGEPVPAPSAEGWSWRATPPPPPVGTVDGRYVGTKPDKGLAIAGWIMFGAGYLGSCVIGAVLSTEDVEKGWYEFVPIGGPVAFGVTVGREIYSEADELFVIGLLVGLLTSLPGLVQATGVILASVGHSRVAKWRRENQVAIIPVGPGGGLGLSMGGRFF